MTPKRVVVLSPHFDDGVFSVGGMIALLRQRDIAVTNTTIYTPPQQWKKNIPRCFRPYADFAQRQKEDERACLRLGATCEILGLIETAFRPPMAWHPLTLFGSRDVNEEDRAYIANYVTTLLSKDPDLMIVAPLAVGGHIDHRTVAWGCLDAMVTLSAFKRIRFFEDPYSCLLPLRNLHPVTRQNTWMHAQKPHWLSLRSAITAVALKAWARNQTYHPELNRRQWELTSFSLTPEAEAKKIGAMAEYSSQVAAFGGIETLAKAVKIFHTNFGFAEPLWECHP